MARAKKKAGRPKGARKRSVETDRLNFRFPVFDHARRRWLVTIFDKITKRRRKIYLDVGTEAEAKRARDRLVRETKDEELVEELESRQQTRRGVRLDDAITEWLASKDIAGATADGYKPDAEVYKVFFGPDRRVHTLLAKDVAALFSSERAGRWKALRTRRKHRFALIDFFEFANHKGWADGNPAPDFELDISVRQRRAEKNSWTRRKLEATLTDEEARKLLKAAQGDVYWFVLLALSTGLRKSNLVGSPHKRGILWSDVNIETATLSIAGERMKSGIDHRVPLLPDAVEELRRLRASLDRLPSPGDAILGIGPRGIEDALPDVCERAGIARITPHGLRRAAISRWALYLPDPIVSVLANHTSAATVTDLYKVIPELAVRACLADFPRLIEPRHSVADRVVDRG